MRSRTGSEDGGFSPEERAMLSNILSLREVRVDDIMVPRADIDAVDIGITLGGLLVAFQKSGHSRMPVHRETLDDPVGLVHIKDLMSHITRLAAVGGDSEEGGSEGLDLRRVDLTRSLAEADLVRNILFVPPSMPVTALLGVDAGDAHATGPGHRRIWRHRRPRLARGRDRDGGRRHRGRT